MPRGLSNSRHHVENVRHCTPGYSLGDKRRHLLLIKIRGKHHLVLVRRWRPFQARPEREGFPVGPFAAHRHRRLTFERQARGRGRRPPTATERATRDATALSRG